MADQVREKHEGSFEDTDQHHLSLIIVLRDAIGQVSDNGCNLLPGRAEDEVDIPSMASYRAWVKTTISICWGREALSKVASLAPGRFTLVFPFKKSSTGAMGNPHFSVLKCIGIRTFGFISSAT